MSGKKPFDLVFVTHLPAFYKVNLYRALAKRCRLFVIFIASESEIRGHGFSTHAQIDFPHTILYEGPFERRPRLKTCFRMYQALRNIQAKHYVVGGWDLPEFWLLTFVKSRQHNAVAVESIPAPAGTPPWKQALKRLFLSRVSRGFVSGKAQAKLLEHLHFEGQLHFTGGVGLFHWDVHSPDERQEIKRFIYVGRYSSEKNVDLLLEAFADRPSLQLTCIGQGPKEQQLKAKATANVTFLPALRHDALAPVLLKHDVLILPSLQEAWGLVIEEAQHCRLPVVVSSAVGCAYERVIQPGAGLMFESNNKQSLLGCLDQMSDLATYQRYQKAVQAMHLQDFATQQIESYLVI